MVSKDLNEILASEAARMDAQGQHERGYSKIDPAKEPSQVYSVRIPVAHIERLRMIARERSQAPSTLLREWVLEQLAVEEARSALEGPGGQSGQKGGEYRIVSTHSSNVGPLAPRSLLPLVA